MIFDGGLMCLVVFFILQLPGEIHSRPRIASNFQHTDWDRSLSGQSEEDRVSSEQLPVSSRELMRALLHLAKAGNMGKLLPTVLPPPQGRIKELSGAEEPFDSPFSVGPVPQLLTNLSVLPFTLPPPSSSRRESSSSFVDEEDDDGEDKVNAADRDLQTPHIGTLEDEYLNEERKKRDGIPSKFWHAIAYDEPQSRNKRQTPQPLVNGAELAKNNVESDGGMKPENMAGNENNQNLGGKGISPPPQGTGPGINEQTDKNKFDLNKPDSKKENSDEEGEEDDPEQPAGNQGQAVGNQPAPQGADPNLHGTLEGGKNMSEVEKLPAGPTPVEKPEQSGNQQQKAEPQASTSENGNMGAAPTSSPTSSPISPHDNNNPQPSAGGEQQLAGSPSNSTVASSPVESATTDSKADVPPTSSSIPFPQNNSNPTIAGKQDTNSPSGAPGNQVPPSALPVKTNQQPSTQGQPGDANQGGPSSLQPHVNGTTSQNGVSSGTNQAADAPQLPTANPTSPTPLPGPSKEQPHEDAAQAPSPTAQPPPTATSTPIMDGAATQDSTAGKQTRGVNTGSGVQPPPTEGTSSSPLVPGKNDTVLSGSPQQPLIAANPPAAEQPPNAASTTANNAMNTQLSSAKAGEIGSQQEAGQLPAQSEQKGAQLPAVHEMDGSAQPLPSAPQPTPPQQESTNPPANGTNEKNSGTANSTSPVGEQPPAASSSRAQPPGANVEATPATTQNSSPTASGVLPASPKPQPALPTPPVAPNPDGQPPATANSPTQGGTPNVMGNAGGAEDTAKAAVHEGSLGSSPIDKGIPGVSGQSPPQVGESVPASQPLATLQSPSSGSAISPSKNEDGHAVPGSLATTSPQGSHQPTTEVGPGGSAVGIQPGSSGQLSGVEGLQNPAGVMPPAPPPPGSAQPAPAPLGNQVSSSANPPSGAPGNQVPPSALPVKTNQQPSTLGQPGDANQGGPSSLQPQVNGTTSQNGVSSGTNQAADAPQLPSVPGSPQAPSPGAAGPNAPMPGQTMPSPASESNQPAPDSTQPPLSKTGQEVSPPNTAINQPPTPGDNTQPSSSGNLTGSSSPPPTEAKSPPQEKVEPAPTTQAPQALTPESGQASPTNNGAANSPNNAIGQPSSSPPTQAPTPAEGTKPSEIGQAPSPVDNTLPPSTGVAGPGAATPGQTTPSSTSASNQTAPTPGGTGSEVSLSLQGDAKEAKSAPGPGSPAQASSPAGVQPSANGTDQAIPTIPTATSSPTPESNQPAPPPGGSASEAPSSQQGGPGIGGSQNPPKTDATATSPSSQSQPTPNAPSVPPDGGAVGKGPTENGPVLGEKPAVIGGNSDAQGQVPSIPAAGETVGTAPATANPSPEPGLPTQPPSSNTGTAQEPLATDGKTQLPLPSGVVPPIAPAVPSSNGTATEELKKGEVTPDKGEKPTSSGSENAPPADGTSENKGVPPAKEEPANGQIPPQQGVSPSPDTKPQPSSPESGTAANQPSNPQPTSTGQVGPPSGGAQPATTSEQPPPGQLPGEQPKEVQQTPSGNEEKTPVQPLTQPINSTTDTAGQALPGQVSSPSGGPEKQEIPPPVGDKSNTTSPGNNNGIENSPDNKDKVGEGDKAKGNEPGPSAAKENPSQQKTGEEVQNNGGTNKQNGENFPNTEGQGDENNKAPPGTGQPAGEEPPGVPQPNAKGGETQTGSAPQQPTTIPPTSTTPTTGMPSQPAAGGTAPSLDGALSPKEEGTEKATNGSIPAPPTPTTGPISPQGTNASETTDNQKEGETKAPTGVDKQAPQSGGTAVPVPVQGATEVPGVGGGSPLPSGQPTSGVPAPPAGPLGSPPDCTSNKGQWSEWKIMGVCSAECGACGVITKIRFCLSYQQGAGCPCLGEYKIIEPCNIGVCPYPHPSCCIPYSLLYLNGHFACGPQEQRNNSQPGTSLVDWDVIKSTFVASFKSGANEVSPVLNMRERLMQSLFIKR